MNDTTIRWHLTEHANKLTDEQIPGETWNSDQLREQFEVIGFAAPFVVVKKKATGEKGSLMFRHLPRLYFDWLAD